MIEFQGLTVRMNANILIDGFSFSVTPRMRIGLVGKNGTGKTTLFNTILGRLEPDKGEIQIPKDAIMAEVAQEITNTELTAFEYILSGDEELVALKKVPQRSAFRISSVRSSGDFAVSRSMTEYPPFLISSIMPSSSIVWHPPQLTVSLFGISDRIFCFASLRVAQ